MGKCSPPVDIPCQLVTLYGGNVMAAQHVYKWCRECDSGQVNVKDEQRSGQPSMSAGPVQDIDVAVQADIHVSIAQLELRFNLSQGTIWDIVYERLGCREVCSRWVPHPLTEEHKRHSWDHP